MACAFLWLDNIQLKIVRVFFLEAGTEGIMVCAT